MYVYNSNAHSAPPWRLVWLSRSTKTATRWVFLQCCGAIGKVNEFNEVVARPCKGFPGPQNEASPTAEVPEETNGEGDKERCEEHEESEGASSDHIGRVVLKDVSKTQARTKCCLPAFWSCCLAPVLPAWSAHWDSLGYVPMENIPKVCRNAGAPGSPRSDLISTFYLPAATAVGIDIPVDMDYGKGEEKGKEKALERDFEMGSADFMTARVVPKPSLPSVIPPILEIASSKSKRKRSKEPEFRVTTLKLVQSTFGLTEDQIMNSEALRPKGAGGSGKCERLAWKGDRLLAWHLAQIISSKYPDADFTELQQRAAFYNRNVALHNFAQSLEIDLQLEEFGGDDTVHVMGTVIEALYALTYDLIGHAAVERAIKTFMSHADSQAPEGRYIPAVSRLQEYAHETRMSMPTYTTSRTGGSDHLPLYTGYLSIDGNLKCTGLPAPNTKAAREAVARAFLESLGVLSPSTFP